VGVAMAARGRVTAGGGDRLRSSRSFALHYQDPLTRQARARARAR
jgi:hypothetical protein